MNKTLVTTVLGGVLALPVFTAGGAASAQSVQRVKSTVHNLSASGPGEIRASSESEVCVFCHTPHNASGVQPLWNRTLSPGPYTIYRSNSLRATVGQPTGASKLCLSCHDGTIALGSVLSRAPISMGGVDRMPAGPSNLGTDLSDDHPISFPYSASVAGPHPELRTQSTLPATIRLDRNGEVQCTSCHEPHDNSRGDFLSMDNQRGELCVACHDKTAWGSSAHATSPVLVTAEAALELGAAQESVADNACGACHSTHGAGGPEWLLHQENISATCVGCHDGRVASDVRAETGKLSVHGIVTEGPPGATGGPFLEGAGLSCADCHDSHAAGSSEGLGADVPTSLARVGGVTIGGVEVESIEAVHELCFRCHGDAPVAVDSAVSRFFVQPNKRLQFQPNNPSFHPVGSPGASSYVPSLRPSYTTGSVIGCEDCHDADDSRRAGGDGPAGPHGSDFSPLLVRRYETEDYTPESPAAYALCYECHERASILADESFPEHHEHVVEHSTPCSACHDPHGISSAQGTPADASHLINFDRAIVFPNSRGYLKFIDGGDRSGKCYLLCHGEDHDPLEYPEIYKP